MRREERRSGLGGWRVGEKIDTGGGGAWTVCCCEDGGRGLKEEEGWYGRREDGR